MMERVMLEETALMLERLACRLHEQAYELNKRFLSDEADKCERQAANIRRFLNTH